MVYKVIGLMSGSSLDGLDIAFVTLQERYSSSAARGWEYTIVHTATYPYPEEWRQRLTSAPGLTALDYQLLHVEYGHYLGLAVLRFIEEFGLHYQVQLVASHGHTAFHLPSRRMTAQLGDGAVLAAVTRINVVSDLRAMDLALGGQGAPIVPMGEKLLLPGYDYYLNLGGIANVSAFGGAAAGSAGAADAGAGAAGAAGQGAVAGRADGFVAYDVCPANRVLNILAEMGGNPYDEGGMMAAAGRVDTGLLQRLNELDYYGLDYPKSLANEFGTEVVAPLIRAAMGEVGGLSLADALRTYVEHVVVQIGRAVKGLGGIGAAAARMLVTGGGAHNTFLVGRLKEELGVLGVEVVVADKELADYKEALVMALLGVLRWREENNVLASVTGASRDSIGGAVWIGQDA